jgi:nucleoside-diphosphate-sugar epimerase
MCARAMKGVTWVFHEAALPSVPRSIKDPVTSTMVNVVGTTTVLKAAVDAGVQRLVYAASSSAYGNVQVALKTEDLMPSPLSPYAVSKLAGEYMLKAFANCYPIETVGLRYFNVFGERQDPHSPYSGVIAKFTQQILRGESPVINGDGEISRDFTYVQNVVEGNLLAATAPASVSGSILNVACGSSISLNQLVDSINQFLGTNVKPTYGEVRSGDIRHSCADITRAREVIGYEPKVDFFEGLRRTVEWYRSNLSPIEAHR